MNWVHPEDMVGSRRKVTQVKERKLAEKKGKRKEKMVSLPEVVDARYIRVLHVEEEPYQGQQGDCSGSGRRCVTISRIDQQWNVKRQ